MAGKRLIRRNRGFRRKRVNQGTWFPIGGSTFQGEGNDFTDASITNTTNFVPSDKSLGPDVTVVPVTQDYTQYPSGSSALPVGERPSLRDYTEGQDYLLKRLVGNVTIIVRAANNVIYSPGDTWAHVQVGAGFFVARASDSDQSLPDLTIDEIDPLDAGNIQNSWIWRRTWILDNPINVLPIQEDGAFQHYELTTNRALTETTGPHFDTKSRRRIKREERLWFAVGVVGWDGGRVTVSSPTADQPWVDWNLDVRLFGKMMRGKASATF